MTKAFLLPFLFLPSLAYAGPIYPSYTPCEGSWDGIGQTACEILGREGYTNFVFDSSNFYLEGILYSNTARKDSIQLVQNLDGSLTFSNLYSSYNSYQEFRQFGYWFQPDGRVIVGIEDLDGKEVIGSDWDYNDLIVRYIPKPLIYFNAPVQFKPETCVSSYEDEVSNCDTNLESVPEPGSTILMLITSMCALWLLRKRNA